MPPQAPMRPDAGRPLPAATARDPLAGRLPPTLLRLRRGAERDLGERRGPRRYRLLGLERDRLSHILIALSLRFAGIAARGLRNATALRRVEREVAIRALPAPLAGLRILHLSDLHLDLEPAIQTAIARCVRTAEYDLCVLTGDYRAWNVGPIEPALEALGRLREHLHGPLYGVLGNHDCLDMIPGLEALGIRMLINESVPIARGGQRLYLAGIDDPHRYRTHNLEAAATAIPPQATAILLAHGPEPYRAAANLGFDLMLCGHTHGGQICLPGGLALTSHTRAPRALRRGAWQWRQMQGYTSPGAGSSVVPARFYCPPEITVHVLRPADAT